MRGQRGVEWIVGNRPGSSTRTLLPAPLWLYSSYRIESLHALGPRIASRTFPSTESGDHQMGRKRVAKARSPYPAHISRYKHENVFKQAFKLRLYASLRHHELPIRKVRKHACHLRCSHKIGEGNINCNNIPTASPTPLVAHRCFLRARACSARLRPSSRPVHPPQRTLRCVRIPTFRLRTIGTEDDYV